MKMLVRSQGIFFLSGSKFGKKVKKHDYTPQLSNLTRDESEWIISQGVYFPPRAGGEGWIFGFYDNKQTKQKNKVSVWSEIT